jgi:hypothetical protein
MRIRSFLLKFFLRGKSGGFALKHFGVPECRCLAVREWPIMIVTDVRIAAKILGKMKFQGRLVSQSIRVFQLGSYPINVMLNIVDQRLRT